MSTNAISVSSSFQILFGTVQHSCLESKHKENTSRYGSGISGGGGKLPSRAFHVLRVVIPTEPVFARMVPACMDSKFDPKEADD